MSEMNKNRVTSGLCRMPPKVVSPQELLPVMEGLLAALKHGATDCLQGGGCTDFFIDAVRSAEKANKHLRRAVESPNTKANSLAELCRPVGCREELGVAIDNFLRHTQKLLRELTSRYHESLNIMKGLPAVNVTKEGNNRYELVETGNKKADQAARSELDDSRIVYFHLTRIELTLGGGDLLIDSKGCYVSKEGEIDIEGSLRAALGCEK